MLIWRCDIQYSITMGGGKGGGSNNTVTQTSAPPQYVQDAYQNLLAKGNQVASTPYQNYTGQIVAGFTPDQTSAMQSVAGAQGMTQPYTQGATADINSGTQAVYPQLQQYNQQNLANYQSPYTNDVINSTMALANQQDATQQSQLMGKAIQSGASPFGGDRAGVAAAQLAGQQALANNSTIAGLENQGFTQAQQELNNQQQLQASTQASDYWRQLSGGQALSGVGTQAQANTLGQASAQLQSGALQQQLAQEQLNVPYQQFQAQQAYPFQTTQFLAGLTEGVGSGSGGTGSTTSPGPSTASQLGGLGLTGFALNQALPSGYGVGSGLSSLFNFKKGGVVGHYDIGGEVPDVSTSWVPTPMTQRASLAVQAPHAQDQKEQNAAGNLSQGSQIGKMIGSLTGSKGGIAPASSSTFGGVDSSTGNNAVSQDAINSNFLSPGNVSSSGVDFANFGFKDGGHVQHKNFGGEVLPIVGDIAGSFFGDPMAGNQAQIGMNLLDKLACGGIAGHYDAGGMVMNPQQAAQQANPIMQQQQSQYSSLPIDKLQQLAAMQPNNPLVQRALQQKKMSGGMAAGGIAAGHFDDGGVAPEIADDDSNALPPDARGVAAPAEVINTSDQALPQPEGELDAKPAVDHSGDTVKLHSEGKTLDTGLPSFKDNTTASSAWEPLLAAGLAMMSGTSPHALVNVGQGGLAGLQALGSQREAALRENQAQAEQTRAQAEQDLRNRQLQQTGQYQTGELGIRQQELAQTGALRRQEMAQTSAYQNAQLALGKFVPVKDVFGNVTSVMNAKTGEIKPINSMAGQDAAANVIDAAPSSNPQDAAAQILAETGTQPAQVMSRQDITGRNAQVKAYNDSALAAKKAIQELDALNAQTGKYRPGKAANWLYSVESSAGMGGEGATARTEAEKSSKNLANAFMQANAGARGSGIRMVEFDANAVPNPDMPDAARNELVAKNKAVANSQIQRAVISNLYPHMHMANVNAIMDNYEEKNPPILPNGSANPKWIPYQDWLKAGRPNTAVTATQSSDQSGSTGSANYKYNPATGQIEAIQ